MNRGTVPFHAHSLLLFRLELPPTYTILDYDRDTEKGVEFELGKLEIS